MTSTRRQQTKTQPGGNSAPTDYDSELWRMADALRGPRQSAGFQPDQQRLAQQWQEGQH